MISFTCADFDSEGQCLSRYSMFKIRYSFQLFYPSCVTFLFALTVEIVNHRQLKASLISAEEFSKNPCSKEGIFHENRNRCRNKDNNNSLYCYQQAGFVNNFLARYLRKNPVVEKDFISYTSQWSVSNSIFDKYESGKDLTSCN